MRMRGLFWLLLGLLGAYALAKVLGNRPGAAGRADTWTRPAEPRPAPAPSPTPTPTAWVDATDGACPTSHPVKAKLSSSIFHVPGGASYERTRADRCYLDPAAAEADGLRAARR